MPKYIDHINHSILLESLPKRIISLVPSQTELLCDLGLEENLVGVTKFCIHPKHLKREKTIVGGTKSFNFDTIDKLKPDLIIANKEENYKEGVEYLQKHYPVWTSDIYTIADTLNMISKIGNMCGVEQKATLLNEQIISLVDQLKSIQPNAYKKATYLIWKDPIMVAGTNNFINEMLHLAGYHNVFNTISYSRYPEVTIEQLKEESPEVILLSSEPFPFKEKHIEAFQKQLPNTQIKLVDGEIYSWYGSRLVYSLKQILNGRRKTK